MGDNTLRFIVLLIYIGSLCSVILQFIFMYQLFKSDMGASIFLSLVMIIYVSFYVAGAKLVECYLPSIKGFLGKHKIDIIDFSSIFLIIILIFGLYFATIQQQTLMAIIIAIVIEFAIVKIANRIWSRLKKRYKWLEKLEEESNK